MPRCSTMITRNTSNVILSVLTPLNVVTKAITKVNGAWKTIRILGNDQTKSQPRPLVTANQVAHQLLVNSLAKPDHHSRRVKIPKAADTRSPRGPSDFTRPFSMHRRSQDFCLGGGAPGRRHPALHQSCTRLKLSPADGGR